MSKLTIAVAKGRMQYDALRLMSQADIKCCPVAIDSRRLIVEDESGQYRFIFVKPVDVPIYVEHGIADCGIVGRDVLLESNADLLQPLDLRIGHCRSWSPLRLMRLRSILVLCVWGPNIRE